MTEEVDTGDLPEQANDAPQEAPAKAWTDDDESEARAFGWKPSTEWQGAKPDGLVESPTEWMDRVKRSRTFTTMAERIAKTEAESAETNRRIQAMNDFALKAQREQLERRIAEISVQQRAAVADADTDRFDALARQRSDLERAQVPPQQHAGPDPVVEAYRQANPWAQNPLIFAEMAAAVDFGMKSGQTFASTKDQLAYAEKVVLQKYPHLAAKQEEPPRPQRPGTVDAGGLAGGRRDGFAALPSEARTAFDRYVREGLYTNDDKGRRSFMEDYNAA